MMGNPPPTVPVINSLSTVIDSPWSQPNRVYMQHKLGKMKPLQASINDSEGFKMRAACVCVKSRKEQEVLLVTGSRGWLIPGGKVEPKEVNNPSESAIREAREEGGVRGELGRYLGEFENTEKGHRTQVFVLYVESLDPEELWEESVRERRWFSLQEAREVLKINKPNHVKYIDKMIQTRSSAPE